MLAEPPADRCPYARPLAEGFAECVTFQPVRYVALDTRHRPLRPVLACRHMGVGTGGYRSAVFYCRCLIGDAEARQALAGSVPSARLELVRQVLSAVNDLIAERSKSLADAKGAELGAVPGPARDQARLGVRAAAAGFLEAAHDLAYGPLRPALDELGVDPEAMLRIVAGAVEDYEIHGFASWVIPDELLDGLPGDVAAFLRGGRAATA